MCIRDRLYAEALAAAALELVYALGYLLYLAPEQTLLALLRHRYAPVSYTHLDVYKRQVLAKLKEPIPLYEPKNAPSKEACR